MSGLLDTFTSYVPTLTLRRLAANPAPITEPVSEEFSAAILLADIAGFTTLAEDASRGEGGLGSEDLSRVLNDYFSQLIAIITEHGGDVVKFAGDGLLAIWTPSPAKAAGNGENPLRAATLCAAQCALVAQKELHNYEISEEIHLAMRLGIGVGDAFSVHLGGVFGRWEFLIAGDSVVQVSRAEKRAQPGQAALSPEAWALVKEACEGAPLAEGGAQLIRVREPVAPQPLSLPALDPQAEFALRAYIPGAILARLMAGQGAPGGKGETRAERPDWLAELRRVTVLFINLPDLDYRLPVEEAQTIMRALQGALYHYEGSVNKLSVDEKGVTLIAGMGLPPLAHEDDAVRAIQVALDIRNRLQGLKVRSAIGIASGQVFCGSIGSEARREYTMIGDVVNLAARLMQSASATGDILVSAAAYQAAQARIAFEPLPPVMLKGKAQPINVYRPIGEKKVAIRPQSALVGRVAERDALAAGIQTLLRGETGSNVFIIEGEAGIGKSRLVEEVRRYADAMGVTTYTGSSDAVEKATLYRAWRPIFVQMLDINLFDDPEKLRRHIRLALGPRMILRLAPLLRDVLGVDFPDNETTAPMTSQARAEAIRTLLIQLLQASITRSPKVLILEDAHWMDSASWALALAVSQQVRPLMLVIASRPLTEPLPPEYTRLLQVGNLRHLKLGPLDVEDTLALVCQRLGVATLPEQVAVLIKEKAEGNPFFSEELAYALRDAGLIQVVEGECQVAANVEDLRTLQFPDTVQGVITSRIDRLSAPQQLTLKVASVIGRVFAYRTLRSIHPIEEDKPQLADYLRTLEKLDLTPLNTPEPELAYIFKHIITQEVAYNMMLHAQRRELHRAVAEWYERVRADDLSALQPVLAHHWSRAEAWPKAVEYSIAAGDGAVRLFAHLEARQHYALALECLTHLPLTDESRRQRVDTLTKLVSVTWVADDPERNQARLAEAEELLKELPGPDGRPGSDRLRLARVHYWLGRLHYLRNAPREAIGYYRQVIAVAKEFGDEELLAIPSSFIGQAMFVQGHAGKARPMLAQAIQPFEKSGNWAEWVRAVGFHGMSITALGQPQEGLAETLRGLTYSLEKNFPTGVALSRIYLAVNYMFANDLPHMLEEARACIAASEQSGDRLLAYLGYGFLGLAYCRLGDHQSAAAGMAQSMTTGKSLGGRLILADWFAAVEAEVALVGGQYEPAIALAEKVVAAAQAGGGIFAEGMAQRVWGRALAQLDPPQWDAAEAHLAAAVQAFETGELMLELARARVAWGQVCAGRGDPAAAREHLAKAAAQFETSGLKEEWERTQAVINELK